MEKEFLREINEYRKYLDVSKNDFKLLLALALHYQNENGEHIHEEKLYEVIEEALNNMDYRDMSAFNDSMVRGKTVKEAFDRALVNLGYQKSKKYR